MGIIARAVFQRLGSEVLYQHLFKIAALVFGVKTGRLCSFWWVFHFLPFTALVLFARIIYHKNLQGRVRVLFSKGWFL